jgi:hypothetical protein
MPYIQDEDAVAVQAWIARLQNLMESVFGTTSTQIRHLLQLMPKGPSHISKAYQVDAITGLLIGALEDLERGFLANREMLIAAEIHDSLVEQAKHLLRAGYKDPAAVLGRVVLEDALRRIAASNAVDPGEKASKINDALKAAGRYPQPRWRQIQTWLDIGNAAAHGKFDEYTETDVAMQLEGITTFIATELHV